MLTNCPCGTGKLFQECCGPYLADEAIPATPEALMRSRYTAYYLVDTDYIIKTMISPALNKFDPEDTKKWAEKAKWTKLEVIQSSVDGMNGLVEFIAYYQVGKKQFQIHELSEFEHIDGRWYYTKGKYFD